MNHIYVRQFYLYALYAFGCAVPPAKVRCPANPVSISSSHPWCQPDRHCLMVWSRLSRQSYCQRRSLQSERSTAAHQTLPLGARVMVTNLENGSATEVLVNDRGPFAKGRIIDLSYAAAQSIHMVGPGTALVRLDLSIVRLPIEAIRSSLDYTLQMVLFPNSKTPNNYANGWRNPLPMSESLLCSRVRPLIIGFISDPSPVALPLKNRPARSAKPDTPLSSWKNKC